ncbi:MAG: DUF2953 domain-containing protein [Clostridia bacterium]|nr:DUF2953 domain-containing protein [Clostridia bacterium]MBQ7048048.1 DUF2953 domain-containing protein [Clostridia bacterium]
MIALYITGGILLLLILLLFIKISVFFSYYGKVPELKIKIGFISLGYNLKELKKEAEEVAEAEPQKIKKVKKKKDRTPPPSLKDSIRVFKAGIMQFWGKYKRYAKLERYVLKISVSTDDPAKTAILYGGISSVAGVLHAWAVSVRKRSKKTGDIYTEVKPDFIAEKTDAAAEIGMSLKVWQIVSCLITAYRTYRKYKKLPPKEGRKVK